MVTGSVVVLAAVAAYVFWPSAEPDSGAATAEGTLQVAWGRPVVSSQGLAAQSGVQITQVAVTGAGGLVDLRFEVVDPNLAAAIHDPATPPAVIDERTGLVVHNLLMDHAHSGAFKTGVTYYYVFLNDRNWLQRHSLVTVLLGNAAVEHVVLQ
jgi:hypothetical protein